MAGHQLEQRQELVIGRRPPVEVREHLDAARPELVEGPARLVQRRLPIVVRQRRDEAGKPIRVVRHELGHAVVGAARQVRGLGPLRVDLDGRRGDGQNLLIALVPVHDPEAHVQIDQHRNVADALADVLPVGCDLPHARDIGFGEDVREDVYFSHGPTVKRVADCHVW